MDGTIDQGIGLVVQVAMGVGLAASAGLRAFLPLLVVGLAGRFDVIPLSDGFHWLGTTPALIVFGVAVVAEILGDKIPLVDHCLDLAQVWVKPIAGVVMVASVVTDLSALQTAVLAIVLGAPTAGAVHVLKAKARVISTVTSAGIANPVLSVIEDAGALAGSVGAILVPLLALFVVVIAVILFWLARRRGRPAIARTV